MTINNCALRLLAAFLVISSLPAWADATLEEIIVTADFRGRSATEIPASIALLDAEQIEQLATQHFEELTGAIANLNWSGDGHRARYFQIRGVGELEQYQGAPNPSVGFLIDDIDFSGIGTVATLFDIERVEVLRGPQGSRYGANALGGLIYMQSAAPTPERNGRLQLSAGGDAALSAGLAFGGSLGESGRSAFRVSGHHHRSNGFRDNPFLQRDDTNGRDETSLRARISIDPGENVDVQLAAFFGSVDNGYDAFAIDNSYTVLSNRPGKDAQDSFGASARIEYAGWGDRVLTSITAIADSEIDFSFDADWGNDDAWAPVIYDYISFSDRQRRTYSQELRLSSTSHGDAEWLLGLYALRLEDDLLAINQGEYFDPGSNFADSLDETFASEYSATNIAIFGQYERSVGSATRLATGLRVEHRSSSYSDLGGGLPIPSDTMVGGELSLTHQYRDELHGFVALSRGYKAGGVNLGMVLPGNREFRKEALWSLEVGIKSFWRGGDLQFNASLFHNLRDDQQVRASFQLDPENNPASFGFLTRNVPRGDATGVEAEIAWSASPAWDFYLNLGLLDSELGGFEREQAHAPTYTVAAGVSYQHAAGWFARLDVSAKDEFFFDVSHDQKSAAYELVHARIGYLAANWSAQLWVRNLFDEDYAVRGFFFGNEPPSFAPALYTRFGDPRQAGITFEKRFGS